MSARRGPGTPGETPGGPAIFVGTASRALAVAIAPELGVPARPCATERFPVGEAHLLLPEPVARREVVLLQSTAPWWAAISADHRTNTAA